MGAQRLSERSKRRIEASVGEPVLRAWAHGGYVFDFVTSDHRHGWWDKKTRQWGWDSGFGRCYESCADLPARQFMEAPPWQPLDWAHEVAPFAEAVHDLLEDEAPSDPRELADELFPRKKEG